MNEFKFSCPACHQPIKVGFEFAGRRLDCPGCHVGLMIPAPPEKPELVPVATLVQPAANPEPTSSASATSDPAATPPQPTTAAPELAAEVNEPVAPPSPPPATLVAPISTARVAVLTPELNLEIVHAVRARLKDKSRWLPGKKEGGQYNYAARQEGDQMVSVSPADVTATHHSLFGAILLEFHLRNVTRVTVGRQKILDEELLAAIQKTLGRKPDGAPVTEAEREALTHEQCLAVLDVLEKRFQQTAAAVKQKQVERKIEDIRLTDLVGKLEISAPIRSEEVACALYYEVEALKQRIAELEQKLGEAK